MHARILHHLFGIAGADVIRAPLWDSAAQGASAYTSNAAFVHEYVTSLLTTSFPNMRPQQVQVPLSPFQPALEYSCHYRVQFGELCLASVCTSPHNAAFMREYVKIHPALECHHYVASYHLLSHQAPAASTVQCHSYEPP